MRRAALLRRGLLLAALLGAAAGFGLRSSAPAEKQAQQVDVAATGEQSPAQAAEPPIEEGQFLKLDQGFTPDKYTLIDDSKIVFGKDPNDPTLQNWADNNLATGLRKHHPKVREGGGCSAALLA